MKKTAIASAIALAAATAIFGSYEPGDESMELKRLLLAFRVVTLL